jgi:hypothetical protein
MVGSERKNGGHAMANDKRSATRTKGPFAALCLALLAWVAISSANTDALVEGGFRTALALPGAQPSKVDTDAPIAGTEDFWLSQRAGSQTETEITLASWSQPVKLGAQVVLSINGQSRAFEIVDISDLPVDVTRVEGQREGAGRAVVVALRDATDPRRPLLRFIVEAGESGTEAQRPHPARSL